TQPARIDSAISQNSKCRGRPLCLRTTKGVCPYDRLIMLLVKNRDILSFLDVSDKLDQPFFMADILPRRATLGQFDFSDNESHTLFAQRALRCRFEPVQIPDGGSSAHAGALRHRGDIRHPRSIGWLAACTLVGFVIEDKHL